MAFSIDNTPSSNAQKPYFLTQIILRVSAIATTLIAASLMLTNKEAKLVYGIPLDARYSYSPAFKFFAFANLVAVALSVVSLVLTFIMRRRAANSTYQFFLFLHDLIVTILLMAVLAAAMAVAYIGKYGNSHTGWIGVCDHFSKFCKRGEVSLALGFLGFAEYLLLTIIIAKNSRSWIM